MNLAELNQEAPTFLQFQPPDALTLPLDLMIVGEETFRQLVAAAEVAPSATGGMRMVCLKHLLALKAHAIRHGHPGRVEKDIDDVIGLVNANGVDVTEPEWRGLFLKYGPPELHEKLIRIREQP